MGNRRSLAKEATGAKGEDGFAVECGEKSRLDMAGERESDSRTNKYDHQLPPTRSFGYGLGLSSHV